MPPQASAGRHFGCVADWLPARGRRTSSDTPWHCSTAPLCSGKLSTWYGLSGGVAYILELGMPVDPIQAARWKAKEPAGKKPEGGWLPSCRKSTRRRPSDTVCMPKGLRQQDQRGPPHDTWTAGCYVSPKRRGRRLGGAQRRDEDKDNYKDNWRGNGFTGPCVPLQTRAPASRGGARW